MLLACNSHAGTDVAALRKAQLVKQPGQEWLAQLLLEQREPVHLLVTGARQRACAWARMLPPPATLHGTAAASAAAAARSPAA